MANIGPRKLKGTVVSDAMDKTVVVEFVSYKMHPKYLKRYKVSTRFKAHDEKNEYHKGDKVVIQASKPFSKDKRWRVIAKY